MARNIFYGGTAFTAFLFLALTFHTTWRLPERDHRENLTEQVARGKGVAVGTATALPITLKHLATWTKSLEARGLVLVPVSSVARGEGG